MASVVLAVTAAVASLGNAMVAVGEAIVMLMSELSLIWTEGMLQLTAALHVLSGGALAAAATYNAVDQWREWQRRAPPPEKKAKLPIDTAEAEGKEVNGGRSGDGACGGGGGAGVRQTATPTPGCHHARLACSDGGGSGVVSGAVVIAAADVTSSMDALSAWPGVPLGPVAITGGGGGGGSGGADLYGGGRGAADLYGGGSGAVVTDSRLLCYAASGGGAVAGAAAATSTSGAGDAGGLPGDAVVGVGANVGVSIGGGGAKTGDAIAAGWLSQSEGVRRGVGDVLHVGVTLAVGLAVQSLLGALINHNYLREAVQELRQQRVRV